MITVQQILSAAGVRYENHKKSPQPGVYLTAAHQLIGAYRDIKSFQLSDPNYREWHAHHIVEYQDFGRLGVTQSLPPRDRQLCVLIPERAHVGRVNSVLRTQNPANVRAAAGDLRRAYRDAYALVGDYCGGGEAHIRRELVAIVEAVFRRLGL